MTDDRDRAGEQEDGELRELVAKIANVLHPEPWTRACEQREEAIIPILRPILQGKREAEREVAEMRKTEAWAAERREDLIDQRDTLEAQLASANAEVGRLKGLNAELCSSYNGQLIAGGKVERELGAANARVEELTEALYSYGDHHVQCDNARSPEDGSCPGVPCDCGFTSALSEAREPVVASLHDTTRAQSPPGAEQPPQQATDLGGDGVHGPDPADAGGDEGSTEK